MPENKIIPVQIPGYSYNVAPTDIGGGYAKGIESAGKSIAGAITGIMGGIDAQGNIQQGMLEQNSSTNDILNMLHETKLPDGSRVLPDDAFNSVMGKGLGARQAAVGLYTTMFKMNLENKLQEASKLTEIAAQGGQSRQTQSMVESGAAERQRAAAAADLEKQRQAYELKIKELTLQQNADPSKRNVAPPPRSGPPQVTSPLTQVLQLGKDTEPQGGSILNKPLSFGLK